MKFHAIGGLPRSGSTLLCNILNQNTRFWASSTSHIPLGIAQLTAVHTKSLEVTSHAILNKDDTIRRLSNSIRGYCEGWYASKNREVIFDKSRLWNHHLALFNTLWPNGKIVLMVRDLRSIFSSIEKRHHETAIFDSALNTIQKTLYSRADSMFGPDGIIGAPLNGIEDVLRRNPGNIVLIKYEDFCEKPLEFLSGLYDQIKEPHFDHDIECVESTSHDVDALYNFKFPHVGTGKVLPNCNQWEKWISPDIISLIMEKFSWYNSHFGYQY